MYSYNQLLDYVSQLFADEHFVEQPHQLFDPIEYTLQLGGKRLRPVMLLASCQMFGGDISQASHAAIGIEVFHNFTLLHDDVMDRSPLRRGQPTVYCKWDENTAILSGDTMFALAWRYFLSTAHPQLHAILNTFNETAIEVCRGQQYDMNFETQSSVTIPQYYDMIYSKTSALFVGALVIGSIYAGADQANQDAIARFGKHLGLAFQLQDDWLDAYGNTDTFGKKIGQDIRDHKKTALILTALQQCNDTERQYMAQLYDNRQLDSEQLVSQILDIYQQKNVKQLILRDIDYQYQQALQAINNIDVPIERKQPLLDLMQSILHRNK